MSPSFDQHDELAHGQPVVIFGMHRSGTSCLAGCLEELGLQLGNVITSAPYNQKGNRENPDIWPIHDAILSRVGAAWDNPPDGMVSWAPENVMAMRQFLKGYQPLPEPWGFKDPRITLLLDGWFSIVPHLRLVASIRHPVAVAKSLAARNGFSEERSFSLWERYNRDVLRWHSLTGCAVVNYDDPHYEQTVRRVATDLGLSADRPLAFRSNELNHHGVTQQQPATVAALWNKLLEIAS
jgi:hypothetical protein